MPRGDREILKADIEDGYTKLSNLILEVMAISKMNGVQKGICSFILRRTYSWGKKEDRITLNEFAEATGSSRSYVSTQLKALVEANVILRIDYSPGKTPLYSFNTRVSEWRKGFVNVKQLHKNITEGLYKCETEGFNKCETLHTEESQEPSDFAGSLKNFKELSSNSSNTGSGSELQEVVQFYQKNVCPALSPLHFEKLDSWMKDGMERDLIIYVMEKAVMAGAYRFDYIDSTLRNLYTQGVRTKEQALVEEERFKRRGGKNVEQGQSKRGSPTRGRGEHKNYSGAGTNLEGLIISGRGNEAVEPG